MKTVKCLSHGAWHNVNAGLPTKTRLRRFTSSCACEEHFVEGVGHDRRVSHPGNKCLGRKSCGGGVPCIFAA